MCLLLLPHPGCLPSLGGSIFSHLCAHTFLHKTDSIKEFNHCNIEKFEASRVLNLPFHLSPFMCSAFGLHCLLFHNFQPSSHSWKTNSTFILVKIRTDFCPWSQIWNPILLCRKCLPFLKARILQDPYLD